MVIAVRALEVEAIGELTNYTCLAYYLYTLTKYIDKKCRGWEGLIIASSQ